METIASASLEDLVQFNLAIANRLREMTVVKAEKAEKVDETKSVVSERQTSSHISKLKPLFDNGTLKNKEPIAVARKKKTFEGFLCIDESRIYLETAEGNQHASPNSFMKEWKEKYGTKTTPDGWAKIMVVRLNKSLKDVLASMKTTTVEEMADKPAKKTAKKEVKDEMRTAAKERGLKQKQETMAILEELKKTNPSATYNDASKEWSKRKKEDNASVGSKKTEAKAEEAVEAIEEKKEAEAEAEEDTEDDATEHTEESDDDTVGEQPAHSDAVIFKYLFRLQASGRTNMMAADRYLVAELGLDQYEAQYYLSRYISDYKELAKTYRV